MRLATTSSTRSWAPPHPTAESKPRDAFVPFNQRASARVAPPVGGRALITCFREVVVDRSLLSGKSYLIGNLQQRRTGRSSGAASRVQKGNRGTTRPIGESGFSAAGRWISGRRSTRGRRVRCRSV